MGRHSPARLNHAALDSSRTTPTSFGSNGLAPYNLLVAAAMLVLSLPSAACVAAGSGPTATMKALRRAPGSEAERKMRIGTDARRPTASEVDEYCHDPRRSSMLAGEHGVRVGGNGRAGSGRASGSLRERREAADSFAGDRDVAKDALAFPSISGEEDEKEGRSRCANTRSADSAEGGDLDISSSSCENYDTEEGRWGEGTDEEEIEATMVAPTTSGRYEESDDDDSSAEEHLSDSYDDPDSEQPLDDNNTYTQGDSTPQQQQRQQRQDHRQQKNQLGQRADDSDNSVEVCVLTWNLAEESPPASDLEFLRHATKASDLVAIGVQEIENLKPRRNEGGRSTEWRRLLVRTLGRNFVRVGHHAMGAVQLTLFARREVLDRVKVIKLTDVVCGVGNVLHNKGGIGAYVRVDRTTFLFVAAHLAAHQGKVEERNAGYWRIVTTLDQEIPPAWVTHASRKRAKRAAAAAAGESAANGQQQSPPVSWLPGARGGALPSRGPFGDCVDRVFFFGDLNYRVDLSREDLERGVSVCRRQRAGKGKGRGIGRIGRRFRPGVTYPGTVALDSLLDFDQLTLARSHGTAFGGFSEARVTFDPSYKYDKGTRQFDTSRKMRPPAWTDRILFSPGGPFGMSSLAYTSVPGSCHSDHRPVYARFRVRLAD